MDMLRWIRMDGVPVARNRLDAVGFMYPSYSYCELDLYGVSFLVLQRHLHIFANMFAGSIPVFVGETAIFVMFRYTT